MARNRLPRAKATVSGAALKNPARYKGQRAHGRAVRSIGEPYATMTAAQVAVWRECASEMPWLHSGHRLLLRLVCMLAARMDADDCGLTAHRVLSAMLSKLGATPIDESKVAPGEDDEGPADAFFDRLH